MMAPGSSAPAPPVTVVGEEFCSPNMVTLTVTKKAFSLPHGNFVVTDVNGCVLMKVHGYPFSLRKERVFCDVDGTPIISMKRKIFSMPRKWNVFKGDSSDQKDLVFTVKKSHIFQFKREFQVFLAGNTSEQSCNFKIKGDWFDRSCTFYLGDTNNIVALMSRHCTINNIMLGKSTFSVTVYPNMDYAFVVSIIILLDLIHKHYG